MQRWILVILLAVCAFADTSFAANRTKNAGYYVSAKQVRPSLLPAPPLPQSRAWQDGIQQIVGIQTYAAPDEVAAAQDEQNLRLELMTRLLGPSFTRVNFPLSFGLLDRVTADTQAITMAAKKHWHTIRPYQLDKNVKLQVSPLQKNDYAYPSGHTSTSFVWAQVLSDLWPEAAIRLNYQAERIGLHRVVAGVHTLDDIHAGRRLGQAIMKSLRKNPDFQNDLQAAQKEIAGRKVDLLVDPEPEPVTSKSKRKNWKSFKSRIVE